MLRKMKELVKKDDGQGMAEYGLILAGIAVVVIGAIYLLGGKITDLFGKVKGYIDNPPSTT